MESVGVIGYGLTTRDLISFLLAMGFRVVVYDDFKSEKSLNTTLEGDIRNGSLKFLSQQNFLSCDFIFIITSPGVPPNHPVIQSLTSKRVLEARKRALEGRNLGPKLMDFVHSIYGFDCFLISEYDFFWFIFKFAKRPPTEVWISGTNGKTTTTRMIEFLLKDKNARSGGNIGTPLVQLFRECGGVLDFQKSLQISGEFDYWILETSSFMLHYTKISRPRVYVLLPVSQDHISWHGSFENYLLDKLSPLNRMRHGDICFLPFTLKEHPLCRNCQCDIFFYRDERDLDSMLEINLSSCTLKPPFLLDAALALSVVKKLFGICDVKQLNDFVLSPHNIHEFLDSKGRLWVDDSKATNVEATIHAIRRYEDKSLIHLILGGEDKGADLSILFSKTIPLKQKLRIYGIGENTKKLEILAREVGVYYESCFELETAVKKISLKMNLGEVGLLSPAAASLDQFESYKERGEKFCFFVSLYAENG